MRILLLSCNTGEGHNSTAKAIMEVLGARGVESEMRDVLACLSEKFSSFVCNWHVRLYKYSPALFDVGYRAIDKANPDLTDLNPVYELLAHGAEKLLNVIRDGKFDAVICVHVFSGMMVTEVRRKFGLKIPCYIVSTDYSCAPMTERCEMDGYFIPGEQFAAEFAARGVPREKLIPSGIPVRQVFFGGLSRQEARERLGLPTEGRVVLLMCGSMGCGPMRKLARDLAERVPHGGTVVAVCGRNEKLYESLADLENPRLRVLGFTDQVPELMDAADLAVMKPGGLSSTEAGCKHLPMVLINAVGGCEARNFEVFLERGFALGSNRADDVVDLVTGVLRCPERLDQMRLAMEQVFQVNAGDVIADVVMKMA